MPDGIWMYEDLGYKNGLFARQGVAELIFPYFAEMVTFSTATTCRSCCTLAAAPPRRCP